MCAWMKRPEKDKQQKVKTNSHNIKSSINSSINKKKGRRRNEDPKNVTVAAAEPMVANIATLPFFSSDSRRLRNVSTSPSLDKPRGSKYPKGAWRGIAWAATAPSHLYNLVHISMSVGA